MDALMRGAGSVPGMGTVADPAAQALLKVRTCHLAYAEAAWRVWIDLPRAYEQDSTNHDSILTLRM